MALSLSMLGAGLKFSYAVEAKVVQKHLDNGLDIIITEMPTSPMVSVYMLVKTGSATEGEFLGTGISHFLEHMLFKGTEKRKVGEIAALIQDVGGHLNAATSFDYTIYTITVPFDQFDVALDVTADMILNSTIDPDETEKERQVIYNEMRLHQDNPGRYHGQMTYSTVFTMHPYQHPIIGYKDLLAAVSREDLYNYYKDHYTPNNMILAIAGQIDAATVLPKVEAAFAEIPRGPYHPRLVTPEPDQVTPRFLEQPYPTEIVRVGLAFPTVNLLHPDLYALDVLAGILANGESTPLYQNLVKDKQLLTSLGSYNYTPIDRGFFKVHMELTGDYDEQIIEDVWSEIERIKDQGVTAEELQRFQKNSIMSHVLNNMSTTQVARNTAVDKGFTGDAHFSDKYMESIKAVTSDDVRRVAKEYLRRNRSSIVVLKPESAKEQEIPTNLTQKESIIQKEELANGLTVLLKSDHTHPVVSIRIGLMGGLVADDPEYAGAMTMMSTLWMKASEDYTVKELAKILELNGIGLSSYSGRNSFGIEVQCLSEDFALTMDILESLFKSPTFPETEIDFYKKKTAIKIEKRKESIFSIASEALRKKLFAGHPYAKDDLGTEETLEKIDQQALRDLYQQWVTPDKMVVSIFGDIQADQVLADISSRFGQLETNAAPWMLPDLVPLGMDREVNEQLDKEQALFMIGFRGPSLYEADRYAVELATSIFGSSFKGRLFTKVREKLGLAYNLGGDVVPGLNTGQIFFYVLTSPDNLENVAQTVMDELRLMSDESFTDSELDAIKTYLKGQQKSQHERIFDHNFTSMIDELYGLGYDYHQGYDQRLDAVEVSDVQRAFRDYMNPDNGVVIKVSPNMAVMAGDQ